MERLTVAKFGTYYTTIIPNGDPIGAEMQADSSGVSQFAVAIFADGVRFSTNYKTGRAGLIMDWVWHCDSFGLLPFADFCEWKASLP